MEDDDTFLRPILLCFVSIAAAAGFFLWAALTWFGWPRTAWVAAFTPPLLLSLPFLVGLVGELVGHSRLRRWLRVGSVSPLIPRP